MIIQNNQGGTEMKDEENRECVLEESSWLYLKKYLNQFPHTEKFGIAVGSREKNNNIVLGSIWPKQKSCSSIFCEIDITDLGVIIPYIIELKEKHKLEAPIGISAWVHTHPHLGLFLSGTDKDTLSNWNGIDPGIIAVVYDVFKPEGEMFKAFTSDFMETRAVLKKIDLPLPFDAFFKELLEELPKLMKKKDRPLEAIFTPFGEAIIPDTSFESKSVQIANDVQK